MNRHIYRRAAWLIPLAMLALGACNASGGGGGEARTMAQVFDEMAKVTTEARAAVPNRGDMAIRDINDDVLETLSGYTEKHADLYDELAEVAPAEYRDQLRDCAEFTHKAASAMKDGMDAAIALGTSLEEDFEADCQNALTELGGPNLPD